MANDDVSMVQVFKELQEAASKDTLLDVLLGGPDSLDEWAEAREINMVELMILMRAVELKMPRLTGGAAFGMGWQAGYEFAERRKKVHVPVGEEREI